MPIRVYGNNIVDYTTWQASTAYEVDDLVVPTTGGVKKYICTVAGTSGLTEPDWTPESGGTISDNGVVYSPVDNFVAPPLTIDTEGFGGYSLKDIWVRADTEEDNEFIVYGSHDGVDWRQIDELSTPQGNRDNRHKGLQNAYRFIKVDIDTEDDIEIEIIAGEA